MSSVDRTDAATAALMFAVKQFDPKRGIKFSTFLGFKIRRELHEVRRRGKRSRFYRPDRPSDPSILRFTVLSDEREFEELVAIRDEVETLLAQMREQDAEILRHQYGIDRPESTAAETAAAFGRKESWIEWRRMECRRSFRAIAERRDSAP